MSKVKAGKGDAAKPSKKDSKKPELSSVKEGRVTKPAQTPKAKSKDIAKTAAATHLNKEKSSKKSKKVKTPSPEPESESESSDSSESESEEEISSSSESSDDEEVETKTPAKTNGVVKAAPAADSDDSSEEDSEDESESDSEVEAAPKANGVKMNGTAKPAAKAESSDEEEEDSSDDSDSSEDEEKPAAKAAPSTVTKTAASSEEDSDDSDNSEADSDEADSDESSDASEEEAPTKKRKAEAETTPVVKKTKTEAEPENPKNLFVGNLSWHVDEEWLSREFDGFGEITGCRIVTDKASGRSKGFGYVEFATASAAKAALEAKKEQELDGRPMNVDFSAPKPQYNDAGSRSNDRAKRFGDQKSAPSDTLFVGNVSFDATNDLISETFQEYGTITRVSLPTDQETGNPKGFGYVGFSSVDEAKAALEALNGMDIAGRSIRLDFATPRSNDGAPRGGRGGGFGGGRGGGRGGRGGFGDRGGRGRGGGRGGRGGFSTNRGGFGDFQGKKMSF